jgi:hypothetical protein
MVAEEMLISSWWSQVTSHKELVKMVQYYICYSLQNQHSFPQFKIGAINSAYNDLLIEEDYKTLRDSIDSFFNDINLAK